MLYIKPHITEKSLLLANQGWYTFRFRGNAVKNHLSSSIEKLYKVNVKNVRTITMHQKTRRVGRLMKHVKQPIWRKAMVKLASGQKIDAFEVSGGEQK